MRRIGLALGIVAALSLGTNAAVLAGHDFSDVPNNHPFHDEITWVVDKDIANGYPDGTYRPGEPVTRQAMAAFMERLYGEVYPIQQSRPFHLIVQCAATTRYAVVGSNGALSRGSAGTTASFLSTGTYSVTFNIDVSNCAFVASVGTTAAGSSDGWATTARLAGNNNGVYIATYDAPV
jgi:hypothetical protein